MEIDNNTTFLLDILDYNKDVMSLSYSNIFNNKKLLTNKKISSPIASLRSSMIPNICQLSISSLKSSPIASHKLSFHEDNYYNDNINILVSSNYLLKKNRSLSCDSPLNYNISKKITMRYLYNKKYF